MVCCVCSVYVFFFFNDTATTEIYTLSLHDALPICLIEERDSLFVSSPRRPTLDSAGHHRLAIFVQPAEGLQRDRKSTRLNSSHGYISYAVFCLKKKKHTVQHPLVFRLPPRQRECSL